MYYVYIVTNKNNTVLYIGITNSLEGRIYDYRERLIEGFTKRYQIALIEKQNPRWVDLFEQMFEGVSL